MPTPSYIIRCTKKELIAPNVYELRFEKPDGFTFKPGQFILFDTPLLSNPEDIQTRACSIASTPDEQELLFVIKVKIDGRLGNFVMHTIKEGSAVRIQGSFGLFTLRPNDRSIIFAATGAGIAPFRTQIMHALQSGDRRRMDLFFGVRTKDDLFWVETFEQLQKEHENFSLHLCLSGDNTWGGNKGRIQNFIPKKITLPESTDLYICGAPEMVSDIKKLALVDWKLPKANVHAEGYI